MNETFTLELTNMAHGGQALGRHNNRVIFVPYVIPGERITARVTGGKKNFAYAEALDLLEASPDRVEPPCPYFGQGGCGGCHWQHIDYDRQLEFKQSVVIDQLERIGKFKEPVVKPVRSGPSPWNYRAYATFTLTEDGQYAFYGDDHRALIPVETCHILHPALLEILDQIDIASEDIHRVKLQVGSAPDDRMIILYTNQDAAPEVEVDFPVSVNLLLGDNEPANLVGSPHVTYTIFDRSFRVTAGGFFQANPPIAAMLVEEVLDRLALEGGETVLDLYSGVGLFTAFIAERAGYVISVESYPPAVNDADANLADLENVDLVEGNVEAVLDDLVGPFDAVLVDPPRTGLDKEVIAGLLRLAPPRIVYVSCDPATFARDARRFAENGYRLLDVQPFDMFPQTFHVENVAVLERT